MIYSELVRSPITLLLCFPLFFFNDTATTEIYTLSLHDALPISTKKVSIGPFVTQGVEVTGTVEQGKGSGSPSTVPVDRKSTRLNSSHPSISYAVFCLKKKKKK